MKGPAMMRLSNLQMVTRIADARAAIAHRISILEAGEPNEMMFSGEPKFAVTIDGVRMGADIRALLRPVLLRELRAQHAALDRDLAALGVDCT